MKYPRTARIFRGQLDAAPFAAVLFLLLLFVLLGSLVYTPGVSIELPVAEGWSGTDKPTIAVAVDSKGQFYFENQAIAETNLVERLSARVKESREPLVLMMQADKATTLETLMRLAAVAREAGIREARQEVLPRLFNGDRAPDFRR
jgi:biopolymer transport protein ExbD